MGKNKELKRIAKALSKAIPQNLSNDEKAAKIRKFFRYTSIASPSINQDELNAFSLGVLPDYANARLRNQARNLQSAVPLAAGFLNYLPSEVLGEKGFILSINTKNKELNKRIEQSWFEYEESCDIWGNFAFEDFEELALVSFIRDGEAFIQLHQSKDGLKLEFIDADLIDNQSDNRAELICGIEFEKDSFKPKFYYKLNPENTRVAKVPAKDIIHIKKPILARSVRGNSLFAPVVLDVLQKQTLKRADINRSRLDSELTGYLRDENDSGIFSDGDFSDFNEEQNEEVEIKERAEVGKMQLLPNGIKAEFAPQRNPTNTQFLMQSTDTEVARALGVSYASYTGDLTKVNYSSIRVGSLEQRRIFKRLQRFFKRRFHNVVFKKWLEFELLNARISLNEFEAVSKSFDFIAQGWEYIDPDKEISAQIKAIQAGLKTRSEILSERGVEVDEFLARLEQDQKIVNAISKTALAIPALEPPQNQNKNQEQEEQ